MTIPGKKSKKPQKAEKTGSPEEPGKTVNVPTESDSESAAADKQAASQTTEAAEPSADQELQDRLTETNERFLRAKAELDNYRKRVQREFSDIRAQVKTSTVQEFLPVFDHFQMAMDHAEQKPDFEALKQGMDLILAEFKRTLETLGITPVEAVGCPFDPTEHEAIAQEPSADVPEGHVVRQWKSGYKMGDKLLRPATVVVSSGKSEADSEPHQE